MWIKIKIIFAIFIVLHILYVQEVYQTNERFVSLKFEACALNEKGKRILLIVF